MSKYPSCKETGGYEERDRPDPVPASQSPSLSYLIIVGT